MTRVVAIAASLVALAVPLAGQAPTPAPPPTKLTPELAITVRRPSDLRWSPDGETLSFVVPEPPSGADRRTHIWIYDAASRETRQFTSSPKSERHPRWSPDGKRLAFLSNRGDVDQIYVIPRAGGEARALTDAKHAISDFAWSPDGTRLACLGPEPKSDEDEKKEKNKDDEHVVDKVERHARLWLADAESGALSSLVMAPWRFESVAWVPSGDRLVAVATDQPAVERPTDRILLISASDGAVRTLLAPSGPFEDVQVAPDGTHIAFVGSRVDGPQPHDLFVASMENPQPRNLTAASIDRPVDDYVWNADGTLDVLVQSGFRSASWRVSNDGRAQPLPNRVMSVSDMARTLSRERVAEAGETADGLPEVWVGETADGGLAPVTSLNAPLAAAKLCRPQVYRYKSFDGREIEATLVKPDDAPGPLPTIALIHGGPTSAWREGFEAWGQLLASAGYAVFYPNVRGSTGYGYEFMISNRADWGGGDFKDIMAGLDDLVARRIADPARLGIGGWSYGGYMASWAITQTTRFKAAVSGAGMSDLAHEFSTEDNPAYDEWFYGLPYEKPEGFRRSSPLTYITKAKTPTLILQGEDDVVDPVGQSVALYRALKRYGVETELVLYPREGHGLREEQHLLDRLRRIVAWYDVHLKAEPTSSR
jgi:dipeptidyl aminopeptidase/acylaminoacyl peptidase